MLGLEYKTHQHQAEKSKTNWILQKTTSGSYPLGPAFHQEFRCPPRFDYKTVK